MNKTVKELANELAGILNPNELTEFSIFEDINYKVNLEWLFEDNLERIIALLFCYHMALEAEK